MWLLLKAGIKRCQEQVGLNALQLQEAQMRLVREVKGFWSSPNPRAIYLPLGMFLVCHQGQTLLQDDLQYTIRAVMGPCPDEFPADALLSSLT